VRKHNTYLWIVLFSLSVVQTLLNSKRLNQLNLILIISFCLRCTENNTIIIPPLISVFPVLKVSSCISRTPCIHLSHLGTPLRKGEQEITQYNRKREVIVTWWCRQGKQSAKQSVESLQPCMYSALLYSKAVDLGVKLWLHNWSQTSHITWLVWWP